MKQLSKLKELHAKTTRGEWKAILDFPTDSVCCDGAVIATSIYKTSNSEFITEAHKTVPRLIEALEKCIEQRDYFIEEFAINPEQADYYIERDNKELEQILEDTDEQTPKKEASKETHKQNGI